MITKAQAKFYQSLHHKKYRKEHGFFVVEGKKIVSEVLQHGWPCEVVLMNNEQAQYFSHHFPNYQHLFEVLPDNELSKISQLATSPGVMAILKSQNLQAVNSIQGFALCLDGVKDPGNLGTIIRLAEWFGFEAIFLINDCVEWTNPKVLQASMGSFLHIPIIETELMKLKEFDNLTHYAFDMHGESVFETKFQKPAILWFGSESHGFSEEFKNIKPEMVTISKNSNQTKTESLNVATAAAIGIAMAANSK
jgi:TrmH family RNA methyltransferase